MGRRAQSIISTVLLAISAALLIAVVVLYVRDRNKPDEPTPPTAVPGHNEAIDVLNAFRAQKLDVSFGEQGTDVRSSMLERPGQMVKVGSARAYLFIYPDVASQEAATLDVAPEDVDLVDISGDPIEYQTIELVANSNVAVVLVDADQTTIDRVKNAVAALT
jgi:hypothetical protein